MNLIPTTLKAIAIAALLATASAAEVRVGAIEGSVEISEGDPPRWTAAVAGQSLQPGTSIRTGAGARAELVLGGGRTARLYENSVLRLPGETPEAQLERGGSLFDVTPGRSQPFRVRTPEVVVSVKGTRFFVGAPAGGGHGTSVFRGAVEMAATKGNSEAVRVIPGLTAVLGDHGIDLARTSFDDPWDAWAGGEIAPEFSKRETSVEAARLALSGRVHTESERLQDTLTAAGIDRVEFSAAPPAADAEVALDPILDIAPEGRADGSGDRVDVLVFTELMDDPAAGGPMWPSYPFTFTNLSGTTAVLGSTGSKVLITYNTETVAIHDYDIPVLLGGDLTPFGSFLVVLNHLNLDPHEFARFLDQNFF